MAKQRRHLLALVSASLCAAATLQPRQSDVPRVAITVNKGSTYQTVDGFGFCEAFQRASAITGLSAGPQAQLLDLLFNTTSGAGLSILRIGLGSSPDSSADHMNSIEPVSPGSPDAPPSYVWDGKASGQVWLAKQALARYGVETFYADAWSAPGYMKTNGRDDQGGWLCGVRGEGVANGTTCQGQSWVKAYAAYLAQYVLDYAREGISFSYLGFLNEPNLIKPYATMQSNGYQAADVIGPLHDALAAANLTTGIACCEGQGWSMQRQLTAEVQAAGAESNLALVTSHAYKGSPPAPDAPLNTTLKVWITENAPLLQYLGLTTTWYSSGAENEGLVWAVNLHNAFVYGNVSAYIYWIGAGSSSVEAPLIYVPSSAPSASQFQVAGNYYAFAHFGRFVRPGAVRLQAFVDNSDLLLGSAYLNRDGSVVVQMVNTDTAAVAAVVKVPTDDSDRQICEMDTWVTGDQPYLRLALTDTSVLEDDGIFTALFPPLSLATFVVRCRWKM